MVQHMRKSASICLCAILGACSGKTASTTSREPETSLAADLSGVAESFTFEPYLGALRSPATVERVGSANAIDASRVLARRLRGKGMRVRFVRGKLAPEHARTVVESLTPAGVAFASNSFPYDPSSDAELMSSVSDHVWLEVEHDGQWLALDPSFAGAAPGDAFATASERFDEIPSEWFHAIALRVRYSTGSGDKTVEIEGPVEEIVSQPISVVIHGDPTFAEGGTGGGGGLAGGITGGLGGGAPKAPGPHSVAYSGELRVGDRVERFDIGDKPKGASTEWLEIELRGPGRADRTIVRDLGGEGRNAPAYRRFDILVTNARVTTIDAQPIPADAERTIGEIVDGKANPPVSDEEVAALRDLTNTSGVGGRGVARAFAVESDALTDELAANTGVTVIRGTPRVLITSVISERSGTVTRTRVSLDLRVDEVGAVPYRGAPESVAYMFQTARGLAESSIEGRLLSEIVGAPVATTARLMEQANAASVPLVVIGEGNREQVRALGGMSASDRQRIEASIAAEYQIIAPQRRVKLDGAARWGWWRVDPRTGEYVGVMEGGEHQAAFDYTVEVQTAGVDDRMGYVFGLLAGTLGSQVLLSAAVLRYTSLTEELKDEMLKLISGLACRTCPRSHGVSGQVIADFDSKCFRQSAKLKQYFSLTGSVKFCKNYNLGVTCAAGFLIGGFTKVVENEAFIKGGLFIKSVPHCTEAEEGD